MKILLVSSSSGSRGGGELYLTNLGAELAARGHDITYWMSDHSRMDELSQIAAANGKVIRADYRNTYDQPFRSLSVLWNHPVSREIARSWNGYDIIHINKQNLEDGLDLLRAARLTGTPTVCMIHITQSAQYLHARNAWIRDAVARYELRRHPGPFVTVPEKRVADLHQIVGGRSVEMIHTGVKLAAQAAPIRCSPLHVISVGRMVPQKRPQLFLEVASKIQARYPEAHFTWVGDGPLRHEWDREVAARNLRAVRTGWQSDVLPLLQEADLYLHTAEFEGLPLSLLEAMGAGLPCAVMSDLLDEIDFLRDNVITFPLRAEDNGLSILDNTARLRTIGQAARSFIQAECTVSRMAEQYEALYKSCIKVAS